MTDCSVCARPAVTTLPARISIDCATSTYAGAHTRLAFCQTCIDVLGTREAVNGILVDRVAIKVAARNFIELMDGLRS